MMKKAIVAVSFGVGDIQVKERCLDALLADVREAFQDFEVYEAWTSSFLRKKMAREGYVYPSLEELLEELKKFDTEDVYIIGGESIYRQMLPYCDVAHVTKIDHAYEADAYFPDLDSDPEWEITADSDEQVYFDITYQFLKYERKKS